MAYASQDDLLTLITQRELLQLTDDDRTGQISAAVVTQVLNEASATVDSYVRTRYQTPLQDNDDATRITRDIAIWMLYSRRPQKMPEGPQARYTNAIAFLKDISSGKASIGPSVDQPLPQVPTGTAVLPQYRDERFNEENIKGFI